MIYRLIRDDRREIRVHGGIWELVLELAYLSGWKPAGTEEPNTEAWRQTRGRGTQATWRGQAWDRADYFSQESQRVGREDASALAKAVFLGLPDVTDDETSSGDATETTPTALATVVEELSGRRRTVARDVAFFASRGGFTIDGTLEASRG